jgi:hypothetical protein
MTEHDPRSTGRDSAEQSRVGLCTDCHHSRRIASSKGSSFWLCQRFTTEPERFAKYPRLPVAACSGFEHSATPRVF